MAEAVVEIVGFVISILVCQAAGFIGSIFTAPAIPAWYKKLKKPSFAPPNKAFAPVWISLYTLMGISLYLVLRVGLGNPQVQLGLVIFCAQLALNVAWSYVFFGRRSIRGGLASIVALWVSILLAIISFLSVSTLAGLLLVPYIVWTSVATLLNYSIMKLN